MNLRESFDDRVRQEREYIENLNARIETETAEIAHWESGLSSLLQGSGETPVAGKEQDVELLRECIQAAQVRKDSLNTSKAAAEAEVNNLNRALTLAPLPVDPAESD